MMRVLVTGATGFIGRALGPLLIDRGLIVRAATRDETKPLSKDIERVSVGEIGPRTDWATALDGVDAVVHLAAHVHIMKQATDTEADFMRINADGTRALAHAARAAGVRRFVLLSSVKAAGERTDGRGPLRGPLNETDTPRPEDAYGRSKLVAENDLLNINDLEAVVLRPPLVYGPGAGGNIERLMGALRRGLPLPLASIQNRRSLIGRTNLCDAILTGLTHAQAPGEVFFVSDGEDVSTPDLISRLARAMAVPARLWPCPPALLRLGGTLSGRGAEIARLTESLQVSSAKIRDRLGWRARETLDQGLRAMANGSARTGA